MIANDIDYHYDSQMYERGKLNINDVYIWVICADVTQPLRCR